jgi:hypothetical protein
MRRSNGSIAPWAFVDGSKAIDVIVSGPLIAHDYPTLLGAAIQGVGLARVPGPLAKAPPLWRVCEVDFMPYPPL